MRSTEEKRHQVETGISEVSSPKELLPMEKLEHLLESGEVARFHTCGGVKPQSVAEHSWGVATILLHIHECNENTEVLALLEAALLHDCAELVTGDVPFPIKKADPVLKAQLLGHEVQWEKQHDAHSQLLRHEEELLHIADCLDGMWYCCQRRRCGELQAEIPYGRWREYLLKSGLLEGRPNALQVFDYLTGRMNDAVRR